MVSDLPVAELMLGCGFAVSKACCIQLYWLDSPWLSGFVKWSRQRTRIFSTVGQRGGGNCPRSDSCSGAECGLHIIYLTNIYRAPAFVEELLWPGPGKATVSHTQGLSSKAELVVTLKSKKGQEESECQVPRDLSSPHGSLTWEKGSLSTGGSVI